MKEFAVNSLSSLSGLAHFKDLIFTVSDEFCSLIVTDLNSQFEFEFDLERNKILKTLSFKERKKYKPDLESLSIIPKNNKFYLHLLPSFSKDNRCTGYLIELNEQFKTLDKDLFVKVSAINYESILQSANANGVELNIEGHLFQNHKLFLFNRGHLDCPSQFLVFNYDFATNKTTLEHVEAVDLGKYQGYSVHWTDACWKSEDSVYFSATVEKVNNAFDDGEVLASFLGEYNLKRKQTLSLTKVLDFEKIEGLSVINDEFVFCVDPDKEGSNGKIFYGFKL